MESGSTRARKRSGRVWLFRGLAIAFPFVCLWLTECCLRWNDVGVDSTLVLTSARDGSGTTHYLNPRADVAYCRDDLRGPEPRGFVLPRPADLIRILVVGASSVQGYPYPSELAFPKQMELVLQRQFGNRKVEVLNAGVVGLSTTPLVDVVSQCFEASPSVIVLYAGHNEFYGVGGVNSNASLSALGIQFRKQRLGQVLSNWAPRSGNDAGADGLQLISRLPTQFRIPADSPSVLKAASLYRSNVARIADLCAAHGVPLILCSPVCNLRGQSPLAFPDQLTVLSSFEGDKDSSSGTSLSRLRQLAAQAPDNAILQYRLAQTLEEQGQYADAAVAYSRARDVDPCRYRAPDSFGDILSEVASDAGGTIHFLDLRPVFARGSDYCVPGDELFLEHVHFTLEGHWLAAQNIARAILEDIYHEDWHEDRLPSAQDRDDWLGVIPEDLLVGDYLAMFVGESPPFDQAVDADGHTERLKRKIKELLNSLDDLDVQCFMSLPHEVQIDDLVDGLGRARLDIGDNDQALNLFKLSTRRRPWMPNGFVFSAVCDYLLGRQADARRCLAQSRSTVMAETARLLRDRSRLEAAMRNSPSGAGPRQDQDAP